MFEIQVFKHAVYTYRLNESSIDLFLGFNCMATSGKCRKM